MNEQLAKFGVAAPFASVGASLSDVFNDFFVRWGPTLEGVVLLLGGVAAVASVYYYIRQGRK